MDHNPDHLDDCPLMGLTILLADDEKRLRQIVVMMVEELGASVIAVDSCEEAIDIYKARQEEISLAMLDLRMEGIGGVEAFRILRQFDPGARIVLASGVRPDPPFIDELHQCGCDFIEKPFDMDQLGTTLAEVARYTS